ESNTESDLREYRVYRSVGGGQPERLAVVASPAFSDKKPEAGKKHIYTITAVDKHDNESGKSPAVEIDVPETRGIFILLPTHTDCPVDRTRRIAGDHLRAVVQRHGHVIVAEIGRPGDIVDRSEIRGVIGGHTCNPVLGGVDDARREVSIEPQISGTAYAATTV